jgi:ATP-dependent DNA helicase RecQ
MAMPRRAEQQAIRRTARERFGWKSLRPGQEEAITAVLAGHDTLAVMPSGSGKSAIYQIAGLLLKGPTIVVSPLLALQRDQLASISANGDEEAEGVAVNSAQGARAREEAWASVRAGSAEYLFLTPEQLAADAVVSALGSVGPSLLVVDEAHCVTAWGHDFRPDYLRIADVHARIGRPCVLALTATAAAPVRAEIVDRLGMRSPAQVVRGFDRPNIHLEVRLHADDQSKREAVLDWVAAGAGSAERATASAPPQAHGLLYVGTRKDAQWYAAALADRGVSAAAYHAGLRARERERVHEAFRSGQAGVVVATSAFGMGIDKPDVRFVAHAQISESLDAYYQEIGRGGRDGKPARAVLFYRIEDLGLRRFFGGGRFDAETSRRVLKALARRARTSSEVEELLGATHRRVSAAVSLLEQAGAVVVRQDGRLTRAPGFRSVDTAVRSAEAASERHRDMERSRLEMMRGYAETTGCRRGFMLGYFGEEVTGPCGNCDTCDEGVHETGGVAVPFAVNERVHHQEFGQGTVMRTEADRVTVVFEAAGYKTLALEALEGNDLLTPEEDAS